MIIDGSEKSLRKFLSELSPVDQVGAEARAAMLATRSIKTSSKAWAHVIRFYIFFIFYLKFFR